MAIIETRIHIGKPPAIVAEALLEPRNAVHWTSNLERFEMASGRPGEEGATAHLHYRSHKGRVSVMEQVVESAEPDRRYVNQLKGDGVTVRVETVLDRTPEGTMVTVHWSARGDSLWTRMLLWMLGGAIAERAAIDLQAFKRLVEAHGALFPPADGCGA
jgi:hypothetical protein